MGTSMPFDGRKQKSSKNHSKSTRPSKQPICPTVNGGVCTSCKDLTGHLRTYGTRVETLDPWDFLREDFVNNKNSQNGFHIPHLTFQKMSNLMLPRVK